MLSKIKLTIQHSKFKCVLCFGVLRVHIVTLLTTLYIDCQKGKVHTPYYSNIINGCVRVLELDVFRQSKKNVGQVVAELLSGISCFLGLL